MSETDDVQPEFRWLERGEGEPIVLLHGLMGKMSHWDDTLESLAPVGRAIALSLPILERDMPKISIAGVARYVACFLDALEIPRAVVGGNSLGGDVALALALDHPERVSGLLLTRASRLFERNFAPGVPHRLTTEYVREKMEEVFFDARLVTPEWVESVRRVVTTRASALRVLRFARAAKRHNIEERLRDVALPARLVWGRDDRITPPDVAERFHRLLPESSLFFLPRCGHAPMLEQPDAFNEVVAEWLVETRTRRLAALVGGLR